MDKWTSPSDHVPVCFETKSGLYVLSWNILNKKWIKNIESNSQGLKDSLLMRMHHLGIRNQIIINQIKEWVLLGVHVICIQECSSDMLKEIQKLKNVTVFHSDKKKNDIGVFILTNKVGTDFKTDEGIYSDDRDHFIMSIMVDGLTIVNTHVPGGKEAKGPKELTSWIEKMYHSKTILVGDMNQDHLAFHLKDYTYHQPSYYTHINTNKHFVNYDHIWTREVTGRVLTPPDTRFKVIIRQ